jgi:membrane protease YdiL (CAAX protease family)
VTQALPAGRSAWPPAAAVAAPVVGLAALGLAFNLARLALRLDSGPVWLSLAAFWSLLGVTIAVAWRMGMSPGQVGLQLPRVIPSALGTVMAGAVLVGTAIATGPALHLPGGRQLLAGAVLFGLGTAPAEELLFRGLMYRLLEPRGPARAVLVSSLAFAAVHVPVYGWLSLPPAIAAGLLLGWLRWWTGSLAAPVLVHTVADLALVWL